LVVNYSFFNFFETHHEVNSYQGVWVFIYNI